MLLGKLEQASGGQIKTTPILPKSAWMPSLPLIGGTNTEVLGFFAIAAVLGVVYWFMLSRSRFGFDLRATGWNPSAAVASGVDARRMVLYTMLISGAVAGLINLPRMLGETHTYTEGFASIGFTGIAVALLGRNHPIGMAVGLRESVHESTAPPRPGHFTISWRCSTARSTWG